MPTYCNPARRKSVSILVGILGDLHIDPRKLDEYEDGAADSESAVHK
jgi:hypothetical protein